MSNNILLVWINERFLNNEFINSVNQYAGEREVVFTNEMADLKGIKDRVDIILGDFPKIELRNIPNLVWYQQFGTGVDWLIKNPFLIEHSFTLTNCSDDHYAVVADQMFALILSVARNIPQFVKSQQQGKWDSPEHLDDPSMFQLRGKTMLIVGLGSIGTELIKRGKAFGMNIIGVRKNPKKVTEGLKMIHPIEQLNSVAKKADIIAACLPNTKQTDKIFNQEFFDAMKTSAYFFNVGRGSTVDEQALEIALKKNLIAGAGLDVFTEEPLPKNSTLWSTPNLLITPHMGGFYREVIETWLAISLDNLKRYTKNQPLRNLVDKQRGY